MYVEETCVVCVHATSKQPLQSINSTTSLPIPISLPTVPDLMQAGLSIVFDNIFPFHRLKMGRAAGTKRPASPKPAISPPPRKRKVESTVTSQFRHNSQIVGSSCGDILIVTCSYRNHRRSLFHTELPEE